jgi:hypothetical protein
VLVDPDEIDEVVLFFIYTVTPVTDIEVDPLALYQATEVMSPAVPRPSADVYIDSDAE